MLCYTHNIKFNAVMLCDSIGKGSWVTAGITTDDVMSQNGNLTTIRCNSTHLTSFAVLVDVVGELEVIQKCYFLVTNHLTVLFLISILQVISVAEQTALQIVSYIGCTISIICLMVTVIFFLWLGYDQ